MMQSHWGISEEVVRGCIPVRRGGNINLDRINGRQTAVGLISTI